MEVKLEHEKTLFKVLPQLSQSVLELLKNHGKLGISEIVTLSGANRNTVKKTLSSLVKDNYIIRNGRGKSSWYSL